jgi:two-component system sensor histidine kinase VicK
MNFLSEPLFQSIFNNPVPRVIVKTDAPNFTIISVNDAQKQISRTGTYNISPQNIWEAFGFDTTEEGNGLLLMNTIIKAITYKEVVLTPVFRHDLYTGNGNALTESWWQIEVTPVAGKDRKKTECLLLTTHTVSGWPGDRPTATDRHLQEQKLSEKLSELNEELAASNEELIVSNEELQRSQMELQQLNEELEQRVSRRTRALAVSEARFRNLVQHAPVAIIVLSGADMIIELANDKMLQLWNKAPDIIGKPLLEARPNMDKHPVFNLLKRVYATGKPYNGYEIKGVAHRNGKAREGYFDAIYQPLKTSNGIVTGLMAVITEVTEQVRARQELDRAYEQASLAKQAAQLGTFDMNLLEGTMEWDDRCRTLFGISHNKRVTYEKDFWMGLHPDDKEKVSLAVDAAFNKSISDGSYDVEYRTIGAEDKKERWVRAKGKVFFDEQNTPVRFIGSVIEITEQKQEEQRKNDFIGIVSHELKTPLTSIKAYIQLLNRKAYQKGDGADTGLLSKAEIQINKMTAMIKGFLDVSRLESGKIHIEKEDFILNTLIEEVIADVSAISAGSSLVFLPCEPILVCADREKISHVIHNILNNAIKYSPVGSLVKVTCTHEDSMATVSIQDKGIGIAKQDLDKLFDRYYRVRNPNMKMISGFGIGLYLSAEIIKRHDGKIWAESEEGKGATFFFNLPEKCD